MSLNYSFVDGMEFSDLRLKVCKIKVMIHSVNRIPVSRSDVWPYAV